MKVSFLLGTVLVTLFSFNSKTFADPSPTPRPGFSLGIPCMKDGQIKNAEEGTVCKTMVKNCDDLISKDVSNPSSQKYKDSIIIKVWDMLSMKIWGFYNGLDVDFKTSTPNDLKGKPFTSGICSVVGEKLKGTLKGSIEISQANFGKKAPCGVAGAELKDAVITTKGGGNSFTIDFTTGAARELSSYMYGGYIFAIKWAAKKNLDQLTDLSDETIKKIVGDIVPEMLTDAQNLNASMVAIHTKMTSQEKVLCDADDALKKCNGSEVSLDDAAQKICSLDKSELLFRSGAIPNLLVFKIMKDAKEKFDTVLGKSFLQGKDPQGQFARLTDACQSIIPTQSVLWATSNNHSRLSCYASCFIGGQFHHMSGGSTKLSHSLGSKVDSCSAYVYTALDMQNKPYRYCTWMNPDYHVLSNKWDGEFRRSGYGQKPTDIWDTIMALEIAACTASAGIGATEQAYYNFKANDANRGGCSPDDSGLQIEADDKLSINPGYKGVIEAVIRNMCGQTSINSIPTACYDNGEIPAKPRGLSGQ